MARRLGDAWIWGPANYGTLGDQTTAKLADNTCWAWGHNSSMGNRIHKVLGYALKIRKYTSEKALSEVLSPLYGMGYKEFDEAIQRDKDQIIEFHKASNPGDVISQHCSEDWGFTLGCFRRHMEDKDRTKGWSISSCFAHTAYSPSVLTIIPIGYEDDWSRYDTTLDHYDEQYLANGRCVGARDRVKWLDSCGIYPWLGMVRMRPPPEGVYKTEVLPFWEPYGESLAMQKALHLNPSLWSQLVGKWSPNTPSPLSPLALKHFLEDYRPDIPLEVTIPFWFIRKAFEDQAGAYNALRPAIQAFWC